MTKGKKALAVIDKNIKEMMKRGLENEEIKERVKEYVEVCKLKDKIAKEIVKLYAKESKTEIYLDDLSETIERVKIELEEEE